MRTSNLFLRTYVVYVKSCILETVPDRPFHKFKIQKYYRSNHINHKTEIMNCARNLPHFLERQKASIDFSELCKVCRSTAFEVLILWKDRSVRSSESGIGTAGVKWKALPVMRMLSRLCQNRKPASRVPLLLLPTLIMLCYCFSEWVAASFKRGRAHPFLTYQKIDLANYPAYSFTYLETRKSVGHPI